MEVTQLHANTDVSFKVTKNFSDVSRCLFLCMLCA